MDVGSIKTSVNPTLARDSGLSGNVDARQKISSAGAAMVSRTAEEATQPVSYTHLDVYKRQAPGYSAPTVRCKPAIR